MSDDLYTLSYVSRCKLSGSGEEIAAQLAAIVAAARRNNSRNGITGALLYSDHCFEQVLEGHREAIEDTFERISTDRRHREITIVHYATIAQRSFEGMALVFSGDPSTA